MVFVNYGYPIGSGRLLRAPRVLAMTGPHPVIASVSEAIPLALARAKQASAPSSPEGAGRSLSGEPEPSGPEAGY